MTRRKRKPDFYIEICKNPCGDYNLRLIFGKKLLSLPDSGLFRPTQTARALRRYIETTKKLEIIHRT